eukprot:12756405-Alexandrium_andersonii.AAC.1
MSAIGHLMCPGRGDHPTRVLLGIRVPSCAVGNPTCPERVVGHLVRPDRCDRPKRVRGPWQP